jgi:hypothetical protein
VSHHDNIVAVHSPPDWEDADSGHISGLRGCRATGRVTDTSARSCASAVRFLWLLVDKMFPPPLCGHVGRTPLHWVVGAISNGTRPRRSRLKFTHDRRADASGRNRETVPENRLWRDTHVLHQDTGAGDVRAALSPLRRGDKCANRRRNHSRMVLFTLPPHRVASKKPFSRRRWTRVDLRSRSHGSPEAAPTTHPILPTLPCRQSSLARVHQQAQRRRYVSVLGLHARLDGPANTISAHLEAACARQRLTDMFKTSTSWCWLKHVHN